MKVVILAGGKGTRLIKYTKTIPKPMIEVRGKPILLHQIENLKKYGLDDIIISIGYLGNVIKEYFGNGNSLGVNIEYIEEQEELGTGGCLGLLLNKVNSDFIFIFGDLIFNINWNKFLDFYYNSHTIASFIAHPNSHPYDSDLLIVDSNSILKKISYKHENRSFYYQNLVKSGIHILNNRIFDYVEKNKKQDFEKDIIKKALYFNEKISIYKTVEYIKDIGTSDRLLEVNEAVSKGILNQKSLVNRQKCIFLDRDGTINKQKGFIYNHNNFELENKVADAIKLINKNGYLCIVITNQPVIARGECTFEELKIIHNKMETLLGEKGAYIDDIYYCPHHPDKGFENEIFELKIQCNCRKPKIGLVNQAVKDYNIDLDSSFFIGDTTTDIMTGKNAGLKTILVNTGIAGKDKKFDVEPDIICKNLFEAVNLIFKFK